MGIIQIAMIGIGAVALALMVKQQKSEYALYLSLSAVVLILVFSMNRLQVVMETIRKIEQYTGIDVAMLKILVKLMALPMWQSLRPESARMRDFQQLEARSRCLQSFQSWRSVYRCF